MLSFTLPDLHLSLLHQLVPSKLGSRTRGVGDGRVVVGCSARLPSQSLAPNSLVVRVVRQAGRERNYNITSETIRPH